MLASSSVRERSIHSLLAFSQNEKDFRRKFAFGVFVIHLLVAFFLFGVRRIMVVLSSNTRPCGVGYSLLELEPQSASVGTRSYVGSPARARLLHPTSKTGVGGVEEAVGEGAAA
jgi:hypothetical protein